LLLRLLTTLSTRRQMATIVVDVMLIVLAYYSAYLLRFEDTFRLYQDLIIASLPIVIACQISAFAIFRVHYGIWRYTGLQDLMRIVKAASAGTVAALIALVYVYRFVGYSRAVFVLDWVLLIVFVSAARLSFRVLAEYLRPETGASSRVLLYGAGEGGMVVLRELRINPALHRSLVGFVDDDPIKQQRWVQGVPVLGGSDQLAEIIRKYRVDELVIASMKIPAERVRRVAQICEEEGVRTVRAALHLG
jgi:UDP-GlcNAc:undecaprenyl-phosphate GlcNAc-1-phosphate transferase